MSIAYYNETESTIQHSDCLAAQKSAIILKDTILKNSERSSAIQMKNQRQLLMDFCCCRLQDHNICRHIFEL